MGHGVKGSVLIESMGQNGDWQPTHGYVPSNAGPTIQMKLQQAAQWSKRGRARAVDENGSVVDIVSL